MSFAELAPLLVAEWFGQEGQVTIKKPKIPIFLE